MGNWFSYSTHKTQQAAYDVLEDMYASGELSDAEPVRVERTAGGRFAITLWDGDHANDMPPWRSWRYVAV